MKSVYVSGPMTGYPDFNFKAFDGVAAELRSGGVKVFSPADHDREVVDRLWPGKRPEDFPGYAEGDLAGYFDGVSHGGEFQLDNMLAWDFTVICNEIDSVVLLPAWEASTGARSERFVGERTGKQIWLAVWGDGGWVDEHGIIHTTPDLDPMRQSIRAGWYFVLDYNQKRMATPVVESA